LVVERPQVRAAGRAGGRQDRPAEVRAAGRLVRVADADAHAAGEAGVVGEKLRHQRRGGGRGVQGVRLDVRPAAGPGPGDQFRVGEVVDVPGRDVDAAAE